MCRPRSCLSLIATMGPQGQEPMQVIRGVSPSTSQKDPNTLVLQEVFAGTGRITTGWKKNGTALEPIEVYAEPHLKKGYKRSHDLLQKEVRERVLTSCKKGEANVWWIAAPCTSFCDWQLENGGSRTFACPEGTGEGPLGQREQEGNVLSTFSAELFEEALDHNQFPICESTASSGRYPKQWDLPAWRKVLNRPDVDFIEFPMCPFGLGPPDDPTAFYVHRTRLVFPKHWPLRQVLLRQCPGVSASHRHVGLRGQRQGQAVTRCTEAGAYAWDFVTSVVAVLQSSLGGGRFLPQQHLDQDVHAGGKRARSESKPREREGGEEQRQSGTGRGIEYLDEDTLEFLELVCEEEDWERLQRTGSLRKEEPETKEEPEVKNDSEETSGEEPLPPNETLDWFLDVVVPQADEEGDCAKESVQRGRSSCKTGGDPEGSEPEDEEHEEEKAFSEDEGESALSTYSRRSRSMDVEESQRRDSGRDLSDQEEAGARDFWKVITSRPYKRVRVHAVQRGCMCLSRAT